MAVPEQVAGGHLVLTPRQPLVAGDAAEDFEASVKRLLGQGYRHLIVDLNAVTAMDSAGIRALVRAHTSAGRVGGTFGVARPTAHAIALIKLARLDSVLSIYDSIVEAKRRPVAWRDMLSLLAGGVACLVIAGIGLTWPMTEPGGAALVDGTGLAAGPQAYPGPPWG